MSTFSDDVVTAITNYMNTSQPEITLQIVRALGGVADAESAAMTSFDEKRAVFTATAAGQQTQVEVPWSHELRSRDEVRADLFLLYERATAAQGN